MTAEDAYEEPTEPDEGMLAPVPEELRDLPAEVVGTPPAPYETALPFHLVSPDDFERVCLVVIERIDGVREVRLYGTRGQADYGIDLVAWDADGVVLYQVKRYQHFTAEDLEDAVDAYAAGGNRQFRPNRLVICTSRPVDESDRREVADKLQELRQKHDFEIDLYDGRQLTRRLSGHPDIIRRFFGDGWVEAIARGTGRRASEASRPDLLAQAVLRGPLRALGLDARLREADREGVAPTDAAAIVGEVADRLEDQGFTAVAEGLRIRQAQLLSQAGDVATAAELLGRLAWRDVSAGRLIDADRAERELRDLELAQAGSGWDTARRLLSAIGQWYTGTADDVGEISELVLELAASGHPLVDDIVLWMCETAAAFRDVASLQASRDLIEAVIAKRTERLGIDDEVAVRLACGIAELTRNWDRLDAQARGGELGHRLAALVLARIARYAALTRDPERAILYYRQALDQACQAECFAEAANVALSWIRVEIEYGFSEDTFRRQDLVEALRQAGSTTVLPATESGRQGKIARAEQGLPAALTYLRQALREAVAAGRLMDERDAESALGEALVDSRVLEEGIQHLVRAGKQKLVEQFLEGQVGWIDLRETMASGAPWEKATAFTTAMVVADYLPDDAMSDIADLALDATQDFAQSHFAPLVWLEAWRFLAAAGERLSEEQATRALDFLEPLIEREPGRYRHNDDEHVAVAIAIYRAHRRIRDRCALHLARLLEQGDSLSHDVEQAAIHGLTLDDQPFVAQLERLADSDRPDAVRLLMHLGGDHPRLRSLAAERVQVELDRAEPQAGRHTGRAGVPETGLLARLVDPDMRAQFAERMITIAEDASQFETNRTQASYALLNVSTNLEEAQRDELLERMLAVAAGPVDMSAPERALQAGSHHPLSTMRARLQWGSLQPAAGRAAARLARTESQYKRVAEVLASLLQQTPDRFTNDIAHALHSLPAEVQPIDLLALARSRSVWARQLAAATWVERPAEAPGIGDRLARDEDVRVRRTLAEGLRRLSENDAAEAEALREVLRQDPAWSVRRLV